MKETRLNIRGAAKFALLVAIVLNSITYAAARSFHPQVVSLIMEIICQLIWAFRYIALPLGAVIFVFAGVYWVYARDDPGKRKTAMTIMIHVVVGLLIVGIAEAIVGGISYHFKILEQCWEYVGGGYEPPW